MRPTRRKVLATTAATIALAGCTGGGNGDGDGGGDDPTATPTETATDTPTATPTETAANAGPTVQVRDHPDLGEVLVGPDGLTLYMFDSDTQGSGASTCTGGCAGTWPPLTVEGDPTGGSGVAAELTTFERENGDTQVAAAGWPLYYFSPDSDPGDAGGQGSNGVWWVLGPDGTPKRPDEDETTAGGGGETTTGGGDDGYY
jgi:predicted lipoprotein with Yx(FWY)xxD motif